MPKQSPKSSGKKNVQRPGNTLSSSSSPINYSSLHHHTSQACARFTDAPTDVFFSPSKSVRRSPLRGITEHKQLNPFIYVFSYHTVDVNAGLQQGLDGAVVAVPCSQVKRGVPATVAGHEVGVGVDQHAHHLHTKGSRTDASFVRPLRFRTRQ